MVNNQPIKGREKIRQSSKFVNLAEATGQPTSVAHDLGDFQKISLSLFLPRYYYCYILALFSKSVPLIALPPLSRPQTQRKQLTIPGCSFLSIPAEQAGFPSV